MPLLPSCIGGQEHKISPKASATCVLRKLNYGFEPFWRFEPWAEVWLHGLSCLQGGSTNVSDLTEEEELCCLGSAMHVAVTAEGTFCGLSKSGSLPVSPGKLLVNIGLRALMRASGLKTPLGLQAGILAVKRPFCI